MNRDEESDSASGPIETDLYFVQDVPSWFSETDLSSFFARFTAIDAVILKPAKSSAKTGYAFVRTSAFCNLVSRVGRRPLLLGHLLRLEPAQDPKHKMASITSQTRRKIFLGNVPQTATADQLLQALQTIGPVESVTPFKVKSDRTKYCYAIMQHLEHAELLKTRGQLTMADPSKKGATAILSVNAFLVKKHDMLLDSKLAEGKLEWVSQSNTRLASTMESFDTLPGTEFYPLSGMLDSSADNNRAERSTTSFKPRENPEAHQTRLANLPQNRTEVSKAGDLQLESDGVNAVCRIRKNLVISLRHRHEIANIRFNILLD